MQEIRYKKAKFRVFFSVSDSRGAVQELQLASCAHELHDGGRIAAGKGSHGVELFQDVLNAVLAVALPAQGLGSLQRHLQVAARPLGEVQHTVQCLGVEGIKKDDIAADVHLGKGEPHCLGALTVAEHLVIGQWFLALRKFEPVEWEQMVKEKAVIGKALVGDGKVGADLLLQVGEAFFCFLQTACVTAADGGELVCHEPLPTLEEEILVILRTAWQVTDDFKQGICF